ncbi:MAG: radical SAM protein [Candidatus Atribacteria bacterium]|nr:radical SAM protein [Candidatus Atribacteria bacterium]
MLSVADKIINELKSRNYSTCMNITGGEPLLDRPVLISLLDFLNQNPVVQELMIITNGLLLNEDYLLDLEKFSKLSTIKLSLEGATSQSNDPIRGRGTYEAILQKIKLIQFHRRFKTVVMFTLQKMNLPELELMLSLGEELNLDGLILERFIPEGQGRGLKNLVLDKYDWESLLKKLIQYFELDVAPEDLLPYKAFWIQFYPELDILGAACNLNEALCIMPDGILYPCRRFIFPLGNILQGGIWTVLEKSQLLQTVTDHSYLKGKCHSCFLEDCYGCRALAYSLYRDPYANDYQCFLK